MAAGGYVEGAVLVVFGAGLAVNQSRRWLELDREERTVVAVRVGLPVLLGASALASAAGTPTWVPAVTLAGFAVCLVAALALGIRRVVRRRRGPIDGPGPL